MGYYDTGYAWNNQGYSQQNYPQNYSQGSQQRGQQPQIENAFAWVYGDVGAKAFPVAPGKTVVLMDYERPVLYLKSTDASGRPLPIETYELVKMNDQSQWSGNSQMPQISQNRADMAEYVKKADLESEVTKIMHQNMGGGMNVNGQ